MSSNKRARSEQSSACTECQRRKGKCIGGRPCTFCTKTGRKCIDQPQVSRIPLTRKNMDDLHDRCQRLETLLLSMDPSMDIEALLGTGNHMPPHYGHDRKHSTVSASSGIATPDEVEDRSDTEEDMNPCKFEWHEDPNNGELKDANNFGSLTDGMASLNINSRQVGYLGRSSAAALLRHVYRLLKTHEFTSTSHQNTEFADLMQSPLPSPRISVAEKRLEVVWNEDSLINAYFTYHHASYPIVHEGVFKDQVRRYRAGEMLKTTTHWQTLMRMVLVTGAFMSYTDYTGPEAAVDMHIYKRVNESFFRLDFFSYGTLEGVQALALMGAYLQKRDNPNTGYNCLGMSLRMALGLGLHRDITPTPSTTPPTLGLELRRRIWWTLYIFDVGASLTFGRPTIPSDKVFTPPPANIHDSHISNKHTALPPPTSAVTVYSALIGHAGLAVLMNRIHLKLFVHPRGYSHLAVSRSLIAKFDEQISAWQASLPSYFASSASVPTWFETPRAVVEWKAMNLRMLMYKCFLDSLSYSPRTFDRDKSASPPCPTSTAASPSTTVVVLDPEVRKCLSYALSTLSSIHAFTISHSTLWHGVGWYATYYVFQSALVLVTAILSVPRDASVGVWRSGVELALECLASVERCTANAARVGMVVRWCLDRIDNLGAAKGATATEVGVEREQTPATAAMKTPELRFDFGAAMGDVSATGFCWGADEVTGILADVAAGDVCFGDNEMLRGGVGNGALGMGGLSGTLGGMGEFLFDDAMGEF